MLFTFKWEHLFLFNITITTLSQFWMVPLTLIRPHRYKQTGCLPITKVLFWISVYIERVNSNILLIRLSVICGNKKCWGYWSRREEGRGRKVHLFGASTPLQLSPLFTCKMEWIPAQCSDTTRLLGRSNKTVIMKSLYNKCCYSNVTKGIENEPRSVHQLVYLS